MSLSPLHLIEGKGIYAIYYSKTAETLGAQVDRRKSTSEKNAQRYDIDEAMVEGGGDEEEDGESEDDNEDGHGSGGAGQEHNGE